MRLHQLVNLRNELEKSVNLHAIHSQVKTNYDNLLALTEICEPRFSQPIGGAAEEHLSIIAQSNTVLTKTQEIIEKINAEIVGLSQRYFEENYQLELDYDSAESIRNARIMQIVNEGDNLLLNRIHLHSTWQYPCLEIGCRDGEYTQHLVAGDPLYIADIFPEFLESTVSKFPPEYQRRVRPYLIQNNQINNLPVNQFGFIFSFNFFNYLSFDSIKQLLMQAMTWLRPGGTIIFTYNNADVTAGAAYAESYFMSYVPKSLLVPMCESIGFEVIGTHDFEPAFCWIELRKPGKLKTIKSHQTLGEIKFR